MAGEGHFEVCLSVALMLEYEDALLRQVDGTGLSRVEVDDVLDYLATAGRPCAVFFRWRPYLPDPKDDMVLELAVTAGCPWIVTFNQKHFREIRHFAVKAITPAAFLQEIGDRP